MTGGAPGEAPMAAWNGGLRFLLELAALYGIGAGAASLVDGPVRWAVAIGVPALAASAWGTFRVPGDPGDATVAVPGLVRLFLEVDVFAAATVGYALAHGATAAVTFAAIVVFHYAAAIPRVRWLLARRG